MRFFRDMSTLGIALTISLIVHAGLLTVRFVDPERFNRVFQDTPLEVILVNAKSNERPDVAKAIAQASLAGGGDLDAGMTQSPLPRSSLTKVGDSAEEEEKRIEELVERRMILLNQRRAELNALPTHSADEVVKNPIAAANAEKRRRFGNDRVATIEKQLEIEGSRPKKRIVSPSTTERVDAIYYDKLRRKIEDKGTENFPSIAGNKLYGELIISMTVDYNGRIIDTKVEESSGIIALDKRALTIARSAAPFEKFPSELRVNTDQLVIVSRFKFTRDETLETKLTSR
ncbi:MAG: TonB family protein [Brachymonas sp.]|nr:TonB family protein [Brachymonas sp.]